MKNKKRVLFTSLFIALLVGICVLCLIFGRGHTVYLDNKATEDGKYNYYDTIKAFDKDGEKIASIGPRERTSMQVIGQTCVVNVEFRRTNNSPKEELNLKFKLPYNMDGIIVNLPALIEGASEDEYLSEFVSTVVIGGGEEDIQTDEYAITSEE